MRWEAVSGELVGELEGDTLRSLGLEPVSAELVRDFGRRRLGVGPVEGSRGYRFVRELYRAVDGCGVASARRLGAELGFLCEGDVTLPAGGWIAGELGYSGTMLERTGWDALCMIVSAELGDFWQWDISLIRATALAACETITGGRPGPAAWVANRYVTRYVDCYGIPAGNDTAGAGGMFTRLEAMHRAYRDALTVGFDAARAHLLELEGVAR